MGETHDALALLSTATRMLAEASTFEDAKTIRDMAMAAQTYARAKGLGNEAIARGTDIRLEAERLMGMSLLAAKEAGELSRGAAQTLSQSATAFTLPDLGITRDESAAAQAIAQMPEKEWKEKKSSAIKRGVTTARGVARGIKKDNTRAEKQATMAATTTPVEDSVWCGDMRVLGAQIASESVDLVLTDPPYPGEFLPLFSDLSAFAARVLKPGGLCLVYSGQIFLPEVMRRLTENLDYLWMCAIKHSGGNQRIFKANVNAGWKPIIVLCKPPLNIWWDSFIDITSGGREKDDHVWQQAESEAAYFIEHLSLPGQVVVDPFCGSGTVLAAASRLGRQVQGIELDPDHAQRARERLAK